MQRPTVVELHEEVDEDWDVEYKGTKKSSNTVTEGSFQNSTFA